jgi:hypothetical protein
MYSLHPKMNANMQFCILVLGQFCILVLGFKTCPIKNADSYSSNILHPVRLAYQPLASSTFLSQQTSQQCSSLRTNQPSATSQPNRLLACFRHLVLKISPTTTHESDFYTTIPSSKWFFHNCEVHLPLSCGRGCLEIRTASRFVLHHM